MKSSPSSNVDNIRKMFEKDLVSPDGKSYKNGLTSPLEPTVAETPSPGGSGVFSPGSVYAKALRSSSSKAKRALKSKPFKPKVFDVLSPVTSPEKPFDESPIAKFQTKSTEAAHNKENVRVPEKKTSQYVRYKSQKMKSDAPSLDCASPTHENKSKVAAPIPFLYPGSPEQGIVSPLGNDEYLSDEIALAEKLGMTEQQTMTTQSAVDSPMAAAEVDAMQYLSSPSAPVRRIAVPTYSDKKNEVAATLSSVCDEDTGPVKPSSLFRSAEKNNATRRSNYTDQVWAQEISDAAEAAALESKFHKSAFVEKSLRSEVEPETKPEVLKTTHAWDEESERPFDCSTEGALDESDQLLFLEEGKKDEKAKKYFACNSLRRSNPYTSKKGFSVKNELQGSSALTTSQILESLKILRGSKKDASESYAFDEKSAGEKFDDEPFAPMSFNADDEDNGWSGQARRVIRSASPKKREDRSLSDEKEERNWKRIALYICLLIVLVICGIFASLFASGVFWREEYGDVYADDWYEATSTATSHPTQYDYDSNVFEGSKVVACGNAVPITELDQTYYGSNWKAFWDPTIDTCGDQMSTGYAVWYSFTTNSSKLVEASTCNNADFDTQITIMSGSCDKTTCISYNDQGCGDQSLVTWFAEADETYYIMVHGYREASGTFGLALTESSHNDQCDNAVKLHEESVLAGTTAGALSSTQPPQCDDVEISKNGVWYTVDNISGFFRAELLHGYSDFTGQVSVYRSMDNADSGCSALVCEKGSSAGSVMWLAEATNTYYVYVNGNNGNAGDFDLFLGQNKAASCNFGPRIDPNSVGYIASTEGFNPQSVKSCGHRGYHTAPGVWFSVEGNGKVLEASTCGSSFDLDTQISVFGNGCDSLQCIGGTGQEHPCGEKGSVTWETQVGEIYHVYVSGRSGRVGDFVLNINDAPVADGSTCRGPLPLEQGVTSVQSNTTKVPLEFIERCSGSNAIQGVWHKIIGTGLTMTFSVCNNETDFDARITMFTGSCNGLTCISHTQSQCGVNDEVMITTHVGETYYVLVHGEHSSSFGNYRLDIGETEINDTCGTASTLVVSSAAKYFGNTLSAKKSSTDTCTGDVDEGSNALWYSFMGTGEIVTISTCSYLTDFDTDIRIFNGSCSDFECVSDIDNSYAVNKCGQQSRISFQSVSDELYYARIGGASPNDAGNFVLEVNPKSTFFGS
mmetsp:Transcript_23092/g.64021  ORF Transcript_23092/g.64021 Transcript_23092/m.64021 type:complete len:1199 (+) Transcript_23092:123-3719(+)|eukprot:CAMPEP_0172379550 /NCGR_PEP_ID=MMETSP1060-20121228/69988_1 /TAXON_ID=37318 /ORGANISM="Pseudo-nitzschia pungens, Strain cf. cingulata" /LENGTH=1198 /DNA_ID=CAMNT_0013107291 /DNA_START=38 /DNA_END=3634 /DNA_ORIENTATION=+